MDIGVMVLYSDIQRLDTTFMNIFLVVLYLGLLFGEFLHGLGDKIG
jgi:hypothetical protein